MAPEVQDAGTAQGSPTPTPVALSPTAVPLAQAEGSYDRQVVGDWTVSVYATSWKNFQDSNIRFLEPKVHLSVEPLPSFKDESRKFQLIYEVASADGTIYWADRQEFEAFNDVFTFSHHVPVSGVYEVRGTLSNQEFSVEVDVENQAPVIGAVAPPGTWRTTRLEEEEIRHFVNLSGQWSIEGPSDQLEGRRFPLRFGHAFYKSRLDLELDSAVLAPVSERGGTESNRLSPLDNRGATLWETWGLRMTYRGRLDYVHGHYDRDNELCQSSEYAIEVAGLLQYYPEAEIYTFVVDQPTGLGPPSFWEHITLYGVSYQDTDDFELGRFDQKSVEEGAFGFRLELKTDDLEPYAGPVDSSGSEECSPSLTYGQYGDWGTHFAASRAEAEVEPRGVLVSAVEGIGVLEEGPDNVPNVFGMIVSTRLLVDGQAQGGVNLKVGFKDHTLGGDAVILAVSGSANDLFDEPDIQLNVSNRPSGLAMVPPQVSAHNSANTNENGVVFTRLRIRGQDADVVHTLRFEIDDPEFLEKSGLSRVPGSGVRRGGGLE